MNMPQGKSETKTETFYPESDSLKIALLKLRRARNVKTKK